MFQTTLISTVLFVTTVLNLAVTFVSWSRAKTGAAVYFAWGVTSITLWTLAAGLGYAAIPLGLKILFAKIDAVGYNFALTFFLLTLLHFAGLERWAENKWLRGVLFLIPVTNILWIATNELHHMVWTGFTPADNNVVIFERGPAHTWIAVTGYTLIITIIVILWRLTRHGSALRRRQARLLLAAALIPFGANLAYIYGIGGLPGVDWSSVTFSVTALFFLRALQSARFNDIIPVARDRLISSLNDGMLVVDDQQRIMDANPAAETILGMRAAALIGREIRDVLPMLAPHLANPAAETVRTEFATDGTPRQYYDVQIASLREREGGQPVGSLILLHDITDRKTNELRLLQLTRAVEQSPVSVVITDVQGNITYVNPFFTMVTGYSASQVIGKNMSILKSGQTPREAYETLWQTLLAGRVWDGEFLNKKKDGGLYWEHTIMAPVVDANGDIQSFIAVKEDITGRKLAEQTLENRFLEIQSLNHELQEAQGQIVEQQRALASEEERRRLGRNLHDSVNQSIHGLMLFSETLVDLLQNGRTEQALQAAERIRESGERALREVRLLVYEGQALAVRSGGELVNAVETRLNMVERRVGVDAVFTHAGCESADITAEQAENLYWIILEALNNSLKHAHAAHIRVELACRPGRLEAQVQDDGAGFSSTGAGGGGFGMRSMRERAEIIGGKVVIESSPGGGTRVQCVVETKNTHGEHQASDRG